MENGDVIHLESLITDLVGSLEREMHEGLAAINTRFDTQAARMERQGALLQAGSRWSTRKNGWAEKVDAALEEKDREVADLRERVKRLEDKQGL